MGGTSITKAILIHFYAQPLDSGGQGNADLVLTLYDG